MIYPHQEARRGLGLSVGKKEGRTGDAGDSEIASNKEGRLNVRSTERRKVRSKATSVTAHYQ